MNTELPLVYLARHGETEWSLTGQHTGLTDLPLTERGRRNAHQLGQRLKSINFAAVLTSPLERARNTCELSGFGSSAQVDRDLVEWDYGEYEGLRTAEIQKKHPGWQVFVNGCPGGESVNDVTTRADRILQKIREVNGNVLVFSSGHFIRVFAVRWLGLEVSGNCRYFKLSTASVSVVGYGKSISDPAIWLWNDAHHVST
ncbi:MAG: phosphoglycerate mutase [Planctomycetes bacterium GWF2_50_10]|nr:MAG: phosphoglycerate mutase [Planctomycetes bacterium GWF2_50_10]